MMNLGVLTLGVCASLSGIGMYATSYFVAAERDQIAALEFQIAEDRDALDTMQAEFGVRTSLSRLERINEQVWALKTPTPQQIVKNSAEFAALLPPRMQVEEPQLLLASVSAADLASAAQPGAPLSQRAAASPVQHRAAAPLASVPVPAQEPRQTAVATRAPALVVASAKAQPAPAAAAENLFSDDFLAEVDTAADLERAGFIKVALR